MNDEDIKKYLVNKLSYLEDQLYNNKYQIDCIEQEISSINYYLSCELEKVNISENNEYYYSNCSEFYSSTNNQYMIDQCYNNILYNQQIKNQSNISISLAMDKINFLNNDIDYYKNENIIIEKTIKYKKIMLEVSKYFKEKIKYREIYRNVLNEIQNLSIFNYIKNLIINLVNNTKKIIKKKNKIIFKNKKKFTKVLNELEDKFKNIKNKDNNNTDNNHNKNINLVTNKNIQIINNQKNSNFDNKIKKKKKKKKKKKIKKGNDMIDIFLDKEIEYRNIIKTRYDNINTKFKMINVNNITYTEDYYYNISIKIPCDFWNSFEHNGIKYDPLIISRKRQITVIDYKNILAKFNKTFKKNEKNINKLIVIIGTSNKNIKENPNIIFELPEYINNIPEKDGLTYDIDEEYDYKDNIIFDFNLRLGIDGQKIKNSDLNSILSDATLKCINNENNIIKNKKEKLKSLNFDTKIKLLERNIYKLDEIIFTDKKSYEYSKFKINCLKKCFNAYKILENSKISEEKFNNLVNNLNLRIVNYDNLVQNFPKYFKTCQSFITKIINEKFYNKNIIEKLQSKLDDLKISKTDLKKESTTEKISKIVELCSELNNYLINIDVINTKIIICKNFKDQIILLINFLKLNQIKIFSFVIKTITGIFNNIFFNCDSYIDNLKEIYDIINNKKISEYNNIDKKSILLYIELLLNSLFTEFQNIFFEVINKTSVKFKNSKYYDKTLSKKGKNLFNEAIKYNFKIWKSLNKKLSLKDYNLLEILPKNITNILI